MKTALIGYTGFIGGNLAKQHKFTHGYNSRNIKKIRGKKYDLIVSAGTYAERWKANQNPQADWLGIKKLLGNLKTVKAKHFILISTVDVYPNPEGANEDTQIKLADLTQPYGRNRYKMELAVKKIFPKVTILRLPQTFGQNLKKNFVYDLIHDNALDFTHKDSSLQFYNLKNLWQDVQKAIKLNAPVLNLAVEPIAAGKLARYCLGVDFKTIAPSPPLVYNVTTKYGKYLYPKRQVLRELKTFILKERAKIKIAISNLAWDKTEEKDIVRILRQDQIAGVEIAPAKIWPEPTRVSRTEAEKYKNFWKANAIQVVAITSLFYNHSELNIFKNKDKTFAYLKKIIRLGSWLGAKVMVFGSPKNRVRGTLSRPQADGLAVSFFRRVGAEAKKYGITLCLEPIPASLGTDYINSTTEAILLVKKINHPNIRINLDESAMKLNKERYAETIKKALPLTTHFHISEKGFGVISNTNPDHKKVAIALKKIKYPFWVSIEMRARPKTNHIRTIEKALKFVKRTYE